MDLIRKDRQDKLQIPPLANSSMKMDMMGVPGNIGIPQWMGGLPGMTAFATKLMKDKMEKLDVPTVPEYMQMLVDAGVHLYACKMSVDMLGRRKTISSRASVVVTAGGFLR